MLRRFGNHTVLSAFKRLISLLRGAGVLNTWSVFLSVVDDRYLKCFDRRYRIRTSGFIPLATTSFEPSRLPDATIYGPVNGWAFRRLLKELNLPRRLHFADLGCGLGRACVLAAEYGFEKVTGVELASELCVMARQNIATCRTRLRVLPAVSILQMDVLNFCERTDDDVFFMFRPFSLEFMRVVVNTLTARASSLRKPITIIYSERLLLSPSYVRAFAEDPAFHKLYEAAMFGQVFYVSECNSASVDPAKDRLHKPVAAQS